MIDSTNPRVIADNIRHLNAGEQANASDISDNATAIEALQTYDDAETDTGKKWIDGSSIYRKCFLISDGLPNNTSATFSHSISNLGMILEVSAILVSSSDMRSLNYASNYIRFNSASIIVQSNTDISTNSLYLTLEYTKSAAPAAVTSPTPDDSRSIEPEVIEDPEIRSEEIEPEVNEEAPEEEPVVETKATTRKRSTSTK